MLQPGLVYHVYQRGLCRILNQWPKNKCLQCILYLKQAHVFFLFFFGGGSIFGVLLGFWILGFHWVKSQP